MDGILARAMPAAGQEPQEEQTPVEPNQAKQKYRTNVASVLPENLQEPFERVVLAGMQIMFSKDMQDDIQRELSGNRPMFQKLAESVAGLMGLITQQSKGMPPDVVVPAAIELLHEAAAYVNEVGMGEVSPEETKQATQYLVALLLKGSGAADDQIAQVLTGGQQSQQPQEAANGIQS